MALDPSIALSAKPIQLDDPLSKYANALQIRGLQQQNAMSQLQQQVAQRDFENQNTLMQMMRQGTLDINTPEGRTKALSLGTAGATAAKTAAELAKYNLEGTKLRTDLIDKKLENNKYLLSRVNPNDPNAVTHLAGIMKGAWEDPDLQPFLAQHGGSLQASINSINNAAKQGNLAGFIAQMGQGIEAVKNQIVTQDLGDITRQVGVNPYTGKAQVIEGTAVRKGVSPNTAYSVQNRAPFIVSSDMFGNTGAFNKYTGEMIPVKGGGAAVPGVSYQVPKQYLPIYSKVVTQFNNDPLVKAALNSQEKTKQALDLINSGNKLTRAALLSFAPRSAGETSRLAVAVENRFQGDTSALEKARQWMTGQATGDLTEENKKVFKEYLKVVNKVQQDTLSERRNYFAKQGEALTSGAVSKKRFSDTMGGETSSAPSSQQSTIGATHLVTLKNGQTVKAYKNAQGQYVIVK